MKKFFCKNKYAPKPKDAAGKNFARNVLRSQFGHLGAPQIENAARIARSVEKRFGLKSSDSSPYCTWPQNNVQSADKEKFPSEFVPSKEAELTIKKFCAFKEGEAPSLPEKFFGLPSFNLQNRATPERPPRRDKDLRFLFVDLDFF